MGASPERPWAAWADLAFKKALKEAFRFNLDELEELEELERSLIHSRNDVDVVQHMRQGFEKAFKGL